MAASIRPFEWKFARLFRVEIAISPSRSPKRIDAIIGKTTDGKETSRRATEPIAPRGPSERLTGLFVVPQPAPPAPLHPHGHGPHLLLHRFDAPKPRVDGVLQRSSRRRHGLVRRTQVLPEQRVVHVSPPVELERALQRNNPRDVPRRHGRVQLLQRRVQIGHVRVVVLRVVQLHRLGRNVRREGGVVVREVGEGVGPPGRGRGQAGRGGRGQGGGEGRRADVGGRAEGRGEDLRGGHGGGVMVMDGFVWRIFM